MAQLGRTPEEERLNQAGMRTRRQQFPLIGESRHGRSCWRLPEGYRGVPQLAFSPTELMALVFGRDLMKPLDGAGGVLADFAELKEMRGNEQED